MATPSPWSFYRCLYFVFNIQQQTDDKLLSGSGNIYTRRALSDWSVISLGPFRRCKIGKWLTNRNWEPINNRAYTHDLPHQLKWNVLKVSVSYSSYLFWKDFSSFSCWLVCNNIMNMRIEAAIQILWLCLPRSVITYDQGRLFWKTSGTHEDSMWYYFVAAATSGHVRDMASCDWSMPWCCSWYKIILLRIFVWEEIY